MNKRLLSLSTVAALIIGATAMAARAAPISGVALPVNASMVQNVGWDGDRRWDDDRPWWRHRHRHWDDGDHWRRSWWRWRHHRGDRDWRGDHDYDRGGHREHRPGDWR
jgi:hypothetical protein